MIKPLKYKYHELYWGIAYEAARQSVATRRQVGACLVMPTGMISVGWNGMPAGWKTNECEERIHPNFEEAVTKPEVVHAERNAIDKMTRQGVSTFGSYLFVTTAPCFECAKAIHGLGLEAVYYDDIYHSEDGLEFLKACGITVRRRQQS